MVSHLKPYLLFNGNCTEAFHFYAECLNGKIEGLYTYETTPLSVSEDDKKKIGHGVINLGNELTIMGADDIGQSPVRSGNCVTISLNYDDAVSMEEAFTKLSEGGSVTMPLQDTFWNARFGTLTDKFGISWMFNHHRPNN